MKKAILIDEDLHTAFKIWCAMNKRQMKEITEKLIRTQINISNPKPEQHDNN